MKKYQLYRLSLNISIAILLVGFLFKIQHWPGGNLMMTIGWILSLVYTVIALYEIFLNEEISLFEKGGWLIGFLILTPITGLFYYFSNIKN